MRKCVLITGATRGIGKATAIKFAKSGYDVIINYLNNDILADQLKKELISKYSINVTLIKADVTRENEVIKLKKKIFDKYEQLDVLINNVGIISDIEFCDRTISDFKNMIDINLTSVFLMNKYIGLEMYKNRIGKIINVSSTNGINSYTPTTMDYDAAKAGVISMTKNLAVEFSPYINVNSVAPGWVDTDMNKDLPDDLLQNEKEKILLKRFAKPEEIANVIFFLASDEASYINGQTIIIDGGY